jgi:hypothetical protein
MPLDVVLFQWVRWFWGLTCDFWAENVRKKIKARAKAIKSVVYPFGIHSGPSTMLRAERKPLRGWLRRWAEAQL